MRRASAPESSDEEEITWYVKFKQQNVTSEKGSFS